MLVVAGPGVAHAATLGGHSTATMMTSNSSMTPSAPTVLGCDDFTGTTGASLSGRTVANSAACSSRVWTVHVGTWTIQTNSAASNATAAAVATMNTAFTDGSAEVVLANLNTGGRLGGVVSSHNGTSTYLAAVMIDGAPDRVELRLVVNGTSSLIATSNPIFAATNTLRLTRAGSSVLVYLNSTTTITASLNASQISSLASGGRSGLFGGNNAVRFDDFVATSP